LNGKTIQILLIRQVLDYTILRTEDSRELNTVELPKSLTDTTRDVYGLFLASKQKSVESREFMELLRTNPKFLSTCYLPQNLCMACPRCILFGAVKPSGGKYNIKHRVEYSSAYSLSPFKDINETITFNAINETNQKTGSALNVSHNFKPLTIFPSIVTLKSVTWKEFVLFMKTLLASHSYGAESRVKGDVRNEIIGIIAGYEEIITPLELNLELKSALDMNNPPTTQSLNEKIIAISTRYKSLASTTSKVLILTNEQLTKILNAVRTQELSDGFITELNNDVNIFLSKVEQSGD
jgi:CRISPR type I-D-associated protein Csc2